MNRARFPRQSGAALLAAMLTVTLVATLAAAGLWRQWRNAEVEGAERMHLQAQWVLTGALDWARLILREDARSGGADYLAEPWAVPLEEARLSTFLAADRSGNASNAETDDASQVFLSGNITDLQASMNVYNLVEGGKISEPDLRAFTKLFEVLGLPPTELSLLANNLLQSQAVGTPAKPLSPLTPLPPQRVAHLAWLGLSAPTLVALEPFITWLPQRTTVNVNTASVTVLYASSPRLDMARAQALDNARKAAHFKTLDDANKLIGSAAEPLVDAHHSVNSRYFLVRGRQRQEQTVVQQQSVVYRDGLDVKTLWRTNVAPPLGASALQ